MNPFLTKSIFLWNVPAVADGDPEGIADLLQDGGFETVIIKAANGPYKFIPNPDAFPGWGENIHPELVQTLHRRGFQVAGWGFDYGDNPVGEATVAIAQVKQFNLDGYDLDCESKFESQPGAETRASVLAKTIKTALPTTPLAACGWSYYRNPRKPQYLWHPETVLQALMAYSDVGIPMNYWDGQGATSALWCAQNSLPQWKNLTNKPIIPAARAYNGDGGQADAAGVQAFVGEMLKGGCPGYTFWSLEHAIQLPDVWAAIKTLPEMQIQRAVVSLDEWAQCVDQYLVAKGYTGPGLEVIV